MGKTKERLNKSASFAYLLTFEDKLIAALDPNGFRPLSIGKMANGQLWLPLKPSLEYTGASDLFKLRYIVVIDINGTQRLWYKTDNWFDNCPWSKV